MNEQDWLKSLLFSCHQKISMPESVFLDAGAGSGFLAKHADNIFSNVIALDISPKMLEHFPPMKNSNLKKIIGTCEEIPLPDESVHMVGAFACLHHLFDPKVFLRESYRVLKPGGILYTDHDISSDFVKKFHWPLKIWRFFWDHSHQYLAQHPSLTKEQYKITEFHGDSGLGEELKEGLTGFKNIQFFWHWQGTGIKNKFWQSTRASEFLSQKGRAPMLRILARK